MEIYTLSFLLGAILLLIALFGTGLEIRELKIRKVGKFARIASAILGLLFIMLGLLLSNRLPFEKLPKEVSSTQPSVDIKPNDVKPDAETIGAAETYLLDNGFEGEPSAFTGWNIGDYLNGKTGKEGFQKVYIDKQNGSEGPGNSLSMKYQLGTQRTNRHKNQKIVARIINEIDRDLSSYTGIRFLAKAGNEMTVRFVLVDRPTETAEPEPWYFDFMVSGTWKEIHIPFYGLKISRSRAMARETNQRLELENTETLMWVVNEQIAPLGSEGTIWLDDIVFYKN